jgi:hypothetical protein
VTPGLGVARYLGGVVVSAAVVGEVVWGACSLRAAFLPEWSGARARVAEAVVGVATFVGVAEVLGTLGVLEQWWMAGACLAAGVALALICRRKRASTLPPAAAPDVDPVASPREEIVAAAIAGGFVAAQWIAHVAAAYDKGITQDDSLWYHAAFAARFVQSGRATGLHNNNLSDLATPLHGFLPLTGSLVQAIAMLPFHSDLLSPLVNVGWAALMVLGAVCTARRRGTGALLALGAIVLLGVPTITNTQPGQAANDVGTTALFIAAVALLFEGDLAVTPTALAGIAAGMALGTKLTVLVPIAVLTVGVIVSAVRARRWGPVVGWLAGLLAFGGFWFVRNWIIFGNPVPWVAVHLGPISFKARLSMRPPLASLLGRWSEWTQWIFPGLSSALGRAWWLIFALGVAGAVLGIARGRDLLARFAGVAVLVGIVAIAYIQDGSSFGGAIFVFMVRYFVPSLLLGFVLAIDALANAPVWLRRTVTIVMVAVVAVSATTTFRELPPTSAWNRVVGVLVGVGVAAAVLFLAGARVNVGRTALVTGAIVGVLVVLLAGWPIQRHYFRSRYVNAGIAHDATNALFQRIGNARVEVLGTEKFYPFFGSNLDNDVSRRVASGAADCRAWRQLIVDNRYTYVVVAHDFLSLGIPDERWVSADPAARPVLHDDDLTVYRIDGVLDPNTCP